MKKLFVPLLAAAILLPFGSYAADTYEVASAHSLQIFKYRHLGLSFARGPFDKTRGSYTVYTPNTNVK